MAFIYVLFVYHIHISILTIKPCNLSVLDPTLYFPEAAERTQAVKMSQTAVQVRAGYTASRPLDHIYSKFLRIVTYRAACMTDVIQSSVTFETFFSYL